MTESERQLLRVIHRLTDNAYGVPVRKALEAEIGRIVAIGYLYSVTDRLEEKGYLVSRSEPGEQERGYREKRYWRLTRLGEAAIDWTEGNP